MTDGLNLPDLLECRYKIIDMHQMDCEALLRQDTPGALVLVVLCGFHGRQSAPSSMKSTTGLPQVEIEQLQIDMKSNSKPGRTCFFASVILAFVGQRKRCCPAYETRGRICCKQ